VDLEIENSIVKCWWWRAF